MRNTRARVRVNVVVMLAVLVAPLLALGDLSGVPGQAVVVDAIVARVGPEVILQSELMLDIAPELNSLGGVARDELNRLVEQRMREALDRAIDNKILVREATKVEGLEVTDESVDARIAQIRKAYGGREDLRKAVESAGFTMRDFQEHVRKQILAGSIAVRKREGFKAQVCVREAEVAKYYQDHVSEFTHPERLKVRRIFLGTGSNQEAREEAKARVAEIREKITEGAGFAELAASYSEIPEEAAQGGMMSGWVTRDRLAEDVAGLVFALPEKGVSETIETPNGFVLYKVEQKESERVDDLDAVRALIEPKVRDHHADARYRKWLNERRKRSQVRIHLGQSARD